MKLVRSLALAFMVVLGVSVQLLRADCSGSGVQLNGKWNISCSGSCPTPDTCPSFLTVGDPSAWSATNGFSVLNGDYWVCKCPGTGESSCCHWVLKMGETDTGHQPRTEGDCPSCPANGFCQLNLAKTQAGCTTVQPR